jgi:hypothetical protein
VQKLNTCWIGQQVIVLIIIQQCAEIIPQFMYRLVLHEVQPNIVITIPNGTCCASSHAFITYKV